MSEITNQEPTEVAGEETVTVPLAALQQQQQMLAALSIAVQHLLKPVSEDNTLKNEGVVIVLNGQLNVVYRDIDANLIRLSPITGDTQFVPGSRVWVNQVEPASQVEPNYGDDSEDPESPVSDEDLKELETSLTQG